MAHHDQRSRASAPGTATDEPVPPANPEALPVALPSAPGDPPPADARFATMRAEEIYWAGARHGASSAAGAPARPHMPPGFERDLTRAAGDGDLVSGRRLDPWLGAAQPLPLADPEAESGGADAAAAAPAPKVRRDGWTPERQAIFLDTLAATGVVADACRAAGMSRDSAYAFRNRAAGAAFGLGWDAALLISRAHLSAALLSRAIHGVVDRVYRNGELIAERHRYDNRLTMAVLTRLDRQAEGLGEGAPAARAAAQEWDRYLDIVRSGGEDASAFVRTRTPPPPGHDPAAAARAERQARQMGEVAEAMERLDRYHRYGSAPGDIPIDDLDPAEMESWSEDQIQRALMSGFLDSLTPDQIPDAARAAIAGGDDGKCRSCKLCPDSDTLDEEGEEEEDEFEGCSVWQDELGDWLTDFPPPPGFEGWQEGEVEDDGYRRHLTARELEAIGASPVDKAAELAELMEALRDARDRFFGFVPGAEEMASGEKPGGAPEGADGAASSPP